MRISHQWCLINLIIEWVKLNWRILKWTYKFIWINKNELNITRVLTSTLFFWNLDFPSILVSTSAFSLNYPVELLSHCLFLVAGFSKPVNTVYCRNNQLFHSILLSICPFTQSYWNEIFYVPQLWTCSRALTFSSHSTLSPNL